MVGTVFPFFSLPNIAFSGCQRLHVEQKVADLRKLFRLKELSNYFSQEDFEEARNRSREAQSFPAENIQSKKGPFDLFVQDEIKQGRRNLRAEVARLWRQLPVDQKSEYEQRSFKIKQEIADFEQNKLPQLLNDPKFYWLLRVSSNHHHNSCYLSGFGGKEVPS